MDDELKTVQQVAKAVEETAKATNKGLEVIHAAGSYIGEALGSLPADAVGLAGGDWLREARLRNLEKLRHRTDQIRKDRGVEDQSPELSPSILIPIAEAASNESRDDLQELFARLLANAADPNRDNRVRREFIELVSQLEPLDARMLVAFAEAPNVKEFQEGLKASFPKAQTLNVNLPSDVLKFIGDPHLLFGQPPDSIDLALSKLESLGIVRIRDRLGTQQWLARLRSENRLDEEVSSFLPQATIAVTFETLGRELLRALEL